MPLGVSPRRPGGVYPEVPGSRIRLSPGHAYSVWRVWQDSPGGTWMVELRNPVGKDGAPNEFHDGPNDGFIRIPWKEFARWMNVYRIFRI